VRLHVSLRSWSRYNLQSHALALFSIHMRLATHPKINCLALWWFCGVYFSIPRSLQFPISPQTSASRASPPCAVFWAFGSRYQVGNGTDPGTESLHSLPPSHRATSVQGSLALHGGQPLSSPSTRRMFPSISIEVVRTLVGGSSPPRSDRFDMGSDTAPTRSSHAPGACRLPTSVLKACLVAVSNSSTCSARISFLIMMLNIFHEEN